MLGSISSKLEQAMMDTAYEALFVLNDQLVVLALNARARQFFGERAIPGAPFSELTGSSELDTTLRYVIENNEREFEVQTRVDEHFYRVRTQLHDEQDSGRLITIALQDVTDLVRLNRARRDMVANISHELRTPIANIRLIIDSLFHDADKPKRKQSIQSLRAIARETDSLQWLVHELLDLSMIESGQAILRMVDTELADIIEQATENMAEQAANRDVHLSAASTEGIKVLCDRDLVRRVLINLIHNALKWSPKDGHITVTAEANPEFVTISVHDQGPGVPDAQVERIFERFYQVDDSRSKGEGTGLGLAICKHIVEAHGGKIWAVGTSIAGGGQFHFTVLNADNTNYANGLEAV
jgi:two-component system phosphate regulon sensor histidine kinase PhoR